MGKFFHFNKPGVGLVGVSTFRSSSKCDGMFLCVKSPNPGTLRDWQMDVHCLKLEYYRVPNATDPVIPRLQPI